LSTIFPQIPDKKQAWEDLHLLTQSEDRTVQRLAAYALGQNFPQIPDKKQAWEDLQGLAINKHWFVRTYANHSLGRASIFKATETMSEEDFRKEIT
jgi:HEAT repeat protein